MDTEKLLEILQAKLEATRKGTEEAEERIAELKKQNALLKVKVKTLEDVIWMIHNKT